MNMDNLHPGIQHLYGLLKPMNIGPLIDVVLFWFGPNNQYCALAVGPFGHVPNHQEELLHFKSIIDRIQVPHAWTQVIGVMKEYGLWSIQFR